MSEDLHELFSQELRNNFEFYSYRNAATLLKKRYRNVYDQLVETLLQFRFTKEMIRRPGGSKGPIVKHIDETFSNEWKREARISADLLVKIQTKNPPAIQNYTRRGFLDGHQLDYMFGKVALDVEWNSKDQTFDRDLYAISAFYDANAIDVAVILTRGKSIDESPFLRSLGKVLKEDNSEGTEDVYKKFGASTTNMAKLLYRLEAGRNGGCPVLAIGIGASNFT